MENPIKMDDLGVPLFFGNTHIIGDGHQPHSRGLYAHIKRFPIKGEMTIPDIDMFRPYPLPGSSRYHLSQMLVDESLLFSTGLCLVMSIHEQ